MKLKIDDRRNQEKSPVTFKDLKVGEVYIYQDGQEADEGNGPRLKLSGDGAAALVDYAYPYLRHPSDDRKVIRLKATLVIEADDTP